MAESSQSSPAAKAPLDAPVPTREASFAVLAGFLGWALDAFDYFLVVVCVGPIAAEFKVADSAILFSTTLALAFRPLGALIFGLLADRYGRRIPMMVNLVFYSAVEVATAFAPNITTFLVLRALFGIGMGGEWGVGASLVMEKVPPRWRGTLSGLLQEGYAAGYLLAALAKLCFLDTWGWRPMFLLGGLPALLALFIRLFVRESAVWQKSKAEGWSQLGRVIVRHWPIWIFLTLLMATLNGSSHGTQDNYPNFLEKARGLSHAMSSHVVIVAMFGAVLGGLLFGLASDRFGRRRMMIVAFVGAALVVPLWAFSTQLGWIFAAGFLMQFMVQGAWGIIPAHISELSPDAVRGFLPGFSYQCGNLMAAPLGWWQASLKDTYPYANVLAITAGVVFLLAILVTAVGPERRGLAFGREGHPKE